MPGKDQVIKAIYQLAAISQRFVSTDKKKLRAVIEKKYADSNISRLLQIQIRFEAAIEQERQTLHEQKEQKNKFTLKEQKEQERALSQIEDLITKM